MKKILYLILMTSFFFTSKVSAASLCSYEEQTKLNQAAANIKVSYKVEEEIIHFEDADAINKFIKISAFNITENFYVVIKNNLNNKEMILTYNENGINEFRWDDINSVTNFTFQVYTTNKTSCPDEKIKTIYLTTPRYNDLSNRFICSESTDFYLCQEFVTFAEVKEDVFLKQINEYRNQVIDEVGNKIDENKDATITDKIFDFINSYKWHIICFLGVVAIVLVVISKNNKKKQRDLSL